MWDTEFSWARRPGAVAGGDLKLNVTVELSGSGTTTTNGWP